MPRPKTLPDTEVLNTALTLIHDRGPDALTFAAVAKACHLSSSTLVQRFRTKAGLVQSALLHAWDGLDKKTATLAAGMPKSPDGAIDLLVALSRDYGGIEAYANGLLLLREDLRDPRLRARGAAWKSALCRALEDCFSGAPPGVGLLMAAQWQGALLWWSFDPQGAVEDFVEDCLRRFVAAITGSRGPRS